MMLGTWDGAGYKGLPANGEVASAKPLLIGLWGGHDTGCATHTMLTKN
jgi:hypothetical protein